MKKFTIFLCLMVALFFSVNIVPSQAAEVDVLINKLVEKGILSKQEAQLLLKEMQKEGARQDMEFKETAEKVAKETAEKTVKAEAGKSASDWDFKWKNGFNLKSKDKKFNLKFGGRMMLDGAYINADDGMNKAFEAAGDSEESGWGTEVRRARLFFSGTVYEYIFFKAQYDFAGGDSDIKDMYVGIQHIPVIGKAKIGNFKEPISLNELTSSKYITFMERALPTEAFAPSRNMGVGFNNTALDKRLFWAIGGFQDTDDYGYSWNNFSDWNIAMRVAGRPFLADKDKFLHLGLGYSHGFRNDTQAQVRYRARPEAHLSPNRLVDTEKFYAGDSNLLVPEAAFVYGPFSFQGEYFYNKVDSDVAGNPTFNGWYAYVSFFLTGESRAYKSSTATFDRIKPNHNFSISGEGMGAFELALRYSTVDLTDASINGGKENDLTFGVNWYLTPNTRFMFNYVRADVDDRDSGGVIIDDQSANIFEGRFQIDF